MQMQDLYVAFRSNELDVHKITQADLEVSDEEKNEEISVSLRTHLKIDIHMQHDKFYKNAHTF